MNDLGNRKKIVDVSLLEKEHEDGYYLEIEISVMDWDEETLTFSYECPCGDKFLLTQEQIEQGETIARCPSCSLIVKVIYQIEYESEEFEQDFEHLSNDSIVVY